VNAVQGACGTVQVWAAAAAAVCSVADLRCSVADLGALTVQFLAMQNQICWHQQLQLLAVDSNNAHAGAKQHTLKAHFETCWSPRVLRTRLRVNAGVQVAVNCNLDRGFTWAGGKGQYQLNK
jgi:hypothetical protein